MTASGVDVGHSEAAAPTPAVGRRRRRVPTPGRMLFFLIFLGIPLAVYLMFVVSPFAQSFYYSLTDWSGISPSMNFIGLENYQRILEIGNASTPADAAIVGNESAVRRQLQSLLDSGATDIWAAVFPVGDDRATSRRRATPASRRARRCGARCCSRAAWPASPAAWRSPGRSAS